MAKIKRTVLLIAILTSCASTARSEPLRYFCDAKGTLFLWSEQNSDPKVGVPRDLAAVLELEKDSVWAPSLKAVTDASKSKSTAEALEWLCDNQPQTGEFATRLPDAEIWLQEVTERTITLNFVRDGKILQEAHFKNADGTWSKPGSEDFKFGPWLNTLDEKTAATAILGQVERGGWHKAWSDWIARWSSKKGLNSFGMIPYDEGKRQWIAVESGGPEYWKSRLQPPTYRKVTIQATADSDHKSVPEKASWLWQTLYDFIAFSAIALLAFVALRYGKFKPGKWREDSSVKTPRGDESQPGENEPSESPDGGTSQANPLASAIKQLLDISESLQTIENNMINFDTRLVKPAVVQLEEVSRNLRQTQIELAKLPAISRQSASDTAEDLKKCLQSLQTVVKGQENNSTAIKEAAGVLKQYQQYAKDFPLYIATLKSIADQDRTWAEDEHKRLNELQASLRETYVALRSLLGSDTPLFKNPSPQVEWWTNLPDAWHKQKQYTELLQSEHHEALEKVKALDSLQRRIADLDKQNRDLNKQLAAQPQGELLPKFEALEKALITGQRNLLGTLGSDRSPSPMVELLLRHSMLQLTIAMMKGDKLLERAMKSNLTSILRNLAERKLDGFAIALEKLAEPPQWNTEKIDTSRLVPDEQGEHRSAPIFQEALKFLRNRANVDLSPYYITTDNQGRVYRVN